MTTDLATITTEQREILYNMKPAGVSDNDFMFMLELAKKYKLDPFAHQIYATKVGIIISRDGYLSLAHRSGKFDGMKTTFEHDEKGKLISATTTVWRKDIEHPFEETAYWSDYGKTTEVWNQYKHPMLQKCSERMALSKAFAIFGLYSEAEFVMDDESDPGSIECIDAEVIHAPPQQIEQPKPDKNRDVPMYTEEQAKTMMTVFQEAGITDMSIFTMASLPGGFYDKNMLDNYWKEHRK